MKSNKITFFIAIFCLINYSATGQQLTVEGNVTSGDDASPLPGVNIVVKGTSTGSMTDFDGDYSIKVPSSDATLIFSSLGFSEKELHVNGKTVLNVVLTSDSEQLDEVVVTAFGIERKKKVLGYSAQEVHGDQITVAASPDVAGAFKGKLTGLYMNSSSTRGAGGFYNAVIGGSSSLTGSNQPFYVLDGVPIDNSTLDAAGLFSGKKAK